MRKLFALLGVLVVAPSSLYGQCDGHGQDAPPDNGVLVIDQTEETPTDKIPYRTYFFEAKDHPCVYWTLRDAADAFRKESPSGGPPDSTEAAKSAGLVLKAVRDSSLAPNNRWFATKGAVLGVFVFHETRSIATVRVTEDRRVTRLESDAITLAKVAAQIALGVREVKEPAVGLTYSRKALTQVRATLRVAVTLRPKPTPREQQRIDCAPATSRVPSVVVCVVPSTSQASQVARPTATGPSEDVGKPTEFTMITGPSEHFFLSTNAASGVNKLKFDEKTSSLQPGEQPSTFLIGLNFSVGDLYTEPEPLQHSGAGNTALDQGWRWVKNIFSSMYLGGAVKASDRPFDEIGVIGGLRYNPIPLFNKVISFETVSPYGGPVWVKNDATPAEGVVQPKRKYGKPQWVWGVSLNLDKALGWLSGGNQQQAAPQAAQ